jgi:hypothetical protein
MSRSKRLHSKAVASLFDTPNQIEDAEIQTAKDGRCSPSSVAATGVRNTSVSAAIYATQGCRWPPTCALTDWIQQFCGARRVFGAEW